MGGVAEVKGASLLDGDLSIVEKDAVAVIKLVAAYAESVEERRALADMLGIAPA